MSNPPRTPAHHEADARRVIKGRDPKWLRGYMARHALRILVANTELKEQGFESLLGPGLIEALGQLRAYAGSETGRQRS